MTLDELRQRLSQIEWRDIEFKEAQHEVPKSAFATVSAFANSGGGHVVFGVSQANGQFEVVGVLEPDKVQNDFLSVLRSGEKFSCVISPDESFINADGKTVLAFFIPEARREQKPVHLNRELNKSYIRRGGGDERCTDEEIRRFIRDADARSYDCEVVHGLDLATCFDADSITWYRSIFSRRYPAHETEAGDNLAFLQHFGLLVPEGATLLPTRAALLLFGNAAAINHILPRAVADVRRLIAGAQEVLPEERWDDRRLLEGNLIRCWREGVQYFTERIADRPFQVDASTLHGSDAPPDYLAFREAFLNLLTHQDFGDQSRKAIITFYGDEILFWNPGASFTCGEDFFQPGDKPVRNPRVCSMLQRIGIGERAGTGVRTIYSNQRRLGRLPPILKNDRSAQAFEVILPKQLITSKREQWARQHLGVTLTDAEAAVFLQALRQGSLGPLEAASVSGLNPADTGRLLERLVHQQLLEIHAAVQRRTFRVKPVFADRATVLLAPLDMAPASSLAVPPTSPAALGAAGQQSDVRSQDSLVTHPSDQACDIPSIEQEILEFCQAARSVPAIMGKIGIKHRSYFKKHHLDPLVESGLIMPTRPGQPRHPDQGYITTGAGRAYLIELSHKSSHFRRT
jgi:ATP-dependent DNA helicase RecG